MDSRLPVGGSLIEVHRITKITPGGAPVHRGVLCVKVETPNRVWRQPEPREHPQHEHPRGGGAVPSTLHPHRQRAAGHSLKTRESRGGGGGSRVQVSEVDPGLESANWPHVRASAARSTPVLTTSKPPGLPRD